MDEPNNTLLILASRQDYQRVLGVIQNLDIIPNQVMIEATIAEVTLTDDLKFGLRWHLDGKKSGYSFTGGSSFGSVFPGFSYALAAASAQVTLNALSTITKVNVISSPSLTVLDKQTATLQIGDQVPVVTQSAVGVVAVNAPIVNSVSYRDTGVILSITPRIHESGRVFLKIEQEVSSVGATTSSTINSPTIKQRRIKTTVQIKDGEALALGGLIQDQVNDTRNQIPLLGDIPLIGNAFKEKGGSVGKTELIVLITPRVVRSLNEAREITDEYRRKFDVYMLRPRGTRAIKGTNNPKDFWTDCSTQPMTALAELSQTVGLQAAEQEEDFAEAFSRRLIEANLLDAGSLDRARRAAATTGERFDHVIAKLGLVPEAALLEALACHFGTAVATARDMPTAPVLPEIIRPQFVRSRQVLPLGAEDDRLAVAVVDPFDDEPLQALAYLTGRNVSMLLISADDFAAGRRNPLRRAGTKRARSLRPAARGSKRGGCRSGYATSPTRRRSSALSTRSSPTP